MRAAGGPDPGDPGGPAREVADLVARLRRAMRRAARARQPAPSLSVAQLELLSVVQENPGGRPGDLAVLLRLAPNSVSTLVRALVAAGMLTRSAGDTDRRAVTVDLTPRGRAAVLQWRAINDRLLEAALAGLDTRDRARIASAMGSLERLVAQIDAQADAEPAPVDRAG